MDVPQAVANATTAAALRRPKRPKKLVKGSPATKRWMAYVRSLRGMSKKSAKTPKRRPKSLPKRRPKSLPKRRPAKTPKRRRPATVKGVAKKGTKVSKSGDRSRMKIARGPRKGEELYVSRLSDGSISKVVDRGRSQKADRRKKAKTSVKGRQGDKGDHKK